MQKRQIEHKDIESEVDSEEKDFAFVNPKYAEKNEYRTPTPERYTYFGDKDEEIKAEIDKHNEGL